MKLFLILTIFICFLGQSFAQLPDNIEIKDLPICPQVLEGGWCKRHVDKIRPTQMTVGKDHYRTRKDTINKYISKERKDKLVSLRRRKTTEFIHGPGGEIFINDRHHFSSAVLESNIPHKDKFVIGRLVADWSNETPKSFWKKMADKKWVYLKDANFRPISYKLLPKHLKDLIDLPLRSAVPLVLKDVKNSITKIGVPFEEFYIAEYLNDRGLKIKPGFKTKKTKGKIVEILSDKYGQRFMQELKQNGYYESQIIKKKRTKPIKPGKKGKKKIISSNIKKNSCLPQILGSITGAN